LPKLHSAQVTTTLLSDERPPRLWHDVIELKPEAGKAGMLFRGITTVPRHSIGVEAMRKFSDIHAHNGNAAISTPVAVALQTAGAIFRSRSRRVTGTHCVSSGGLGITTFSPGRCQSPCTHSQTARLLAFLKNISARGLSAATWASTAWLRKAQVSKISGMGSLMDRFITRAVWRTIDEQSPLRRADELLVRSPALDHADNAASQIHRLPSKSRDRCLS
jgi:hypothetical protein